MATPTAKRLAEALEILTTLNSQEADIVKLQFIADQKRIAELKRDLKAEQDIVETLANPTITHAELAERIQELETENGRLKRVLDPLARVAIDHMKADEESVYCNLLWASQHFFDAHKLLYEELDYDICTALGENGETHD